MTTDPIVTIFSEAAEPVPIGTCGVSQILEKVRTSSQLAAQVATVRSLLADDTACEEAKKKLPAATFNAQVAYRNGNPQNLIQHSGIISLDYDHLEPDELEARRAALQADPSVIYAFTSPSGIGVKAGVLVDPLPVDAGEHRYLWQLVAQREVIAPRLDSKAKDISRLTFLSSDEAAYHNPHAAPLRWRFMPNLRLATALHLLAWDHRAWNSDYDHWVQVGMALKHEGEDVDVWRWWTEACGYPDTEVAAKWESFKGGHGPPVTLGSIFQAARARGIELPEPDATSSIIPAVGLPANMRKAVRDYTAQVGYRLDITSTELAQHVVEGSPGNFAVIQEGGRHLVYIRQPGGGFTLLTLRDEHNAIAGPLYAYGLERYRKFQERFEVKIPPSERLPEAHVLPLFIHGEDGNSANKVLRELLNKPYLVSKVEGIYAGLDGEVLDSTAAWPWLPVMPDQGFKTREFINLRTGEHRPVGTEPLIQRERGFRWPDVEPIPPFKMGQKRPYSHLDPNSPEYHALYFVDRRYDVLARPLAVALTTTLKGLIIIRVELSNWGKSTYVELLQDTLGSTVALIGSAQSVTDDKFTPHLDALCEHRICAFDEAQECRVWEAKMDDMSATRPSSHLKHQNMQLGRLRFGNAVLLGNDFPLINLEVPKKANRVLAVYDIHDTVPMTPEVQAALYYNPAIKRAAGLFLAGRIAYEARQLPDNGTLREFLREPDPRGFDAAWEAMREHNADEELRALRELLETGLTDQPPTMEEIRTRLATQLGWPVAQVTKAQYLAAKLRRLFPEATNVLCGQPRVRRWRGLKWVPESVQDGQESV